MGGDFGGGLTAEDAGESARKWRREKGGGGGWVVVSNRVWFQARW